MKSVRKTEEDGLPEDSVIFADLRDEGKFELISTELLNKNARRILKEILRDNRTAPGIAGATGLTIQDVLLHLKRLVEIGFIQEDRKLESFRGRRAKQYKIRKVAALLLPVDETDTAYVKETLMRKAKDIVRKRLLWSLLPTIGWTVVISEYLFGSESSILRRAGLNLGEPGLPFGWLGQPYGNIASILLVCVSTFGLYLALVYSGKKLYR